MHVKPKAVVDISQLFRTFDVIARYTGVINRQIKTHQKDHGCLRHLRQITREQILFVPHHILPWGPDLSWHQGIQAHSGVAHMRDVLALRHTACLWPRYTTRSLPSNTHVQLLSLTTFVYAARRWQGLFVFSTVFLDIPTLALRRLTFPAVATSSKWATESACFWVHPFFVARRYPSPSPS